MGALFYSIISVRRLRDSIIRFGSVRYITQQDLSLHDFLETHLCRDDYHAQERVELTSRSLTEQWMICTKLMKGTSASDLPRRRKEMQLARKRFHVGDGLFQE